MKRHGGPVPGLVSKGGLPLTGRIASKKAASSEGRCRVAVTSAAGHLPGDPALIHAAQTPNPPSGAGSTPILDYVE